MIQQLEKIVLQIPFWVYDESGTRKPKFPTQPESFLLTQTRKKYDNPDLTRTRKIANPTRKPEKT